MLLIQWRKLFYSILSFFLLFSVMVSFSTQSADAAQTRIGTRVVKIATGTGHSLALKSDGTVVAWGDNGYGQTNVPVGLQDVVSIAAGAIHSLALKADGTVVAWGDSRYGQTNVPAGLQDVISIAAGLHESLVLKSDGTVVTWGQYGQNGVPENLKDVVSIATGGYHFLALKSDGTVVTWGDEGIGLALVPADLQGVVAIAAGEHHSLALKANGTVVAWAYTANDQSSVPVGLQDVVAIAAGERHSLALRANGTVVAWGANYNGQTNVPVELHDAVSIAAGAFHSLALTANGTVVAWGANFLGQNNVITNIPAGIHLPVKGASIAAGEYHSLALKSDGTVVAWGDSDQFGLQDVVAIAAGKYHSLALNANGTVFNWGSGNNPPIGLTGVVAIAAGENHSLALKSGGTVVAWGVNTSGQTGVPTGLQDVVSIAAGGSHSLALKSDGTAVAWGANTYGQAVVPAGLQDVKLIAAGGSHSLALKSDGTVVAWGDNSNNKTTIPSGLKDVVSIAAGGNHSLALKSNGTIVAWGDDTKNQLKVPSGLRDVVSIAAGAYHSLALKSDGSIVAWGHNENGQTNVPGNDNLNSLSLQQGPFDKLFSSSDTSYTYSYVGPSVPNVHVTATLADSETAALSVNNQLQASGGTATVNVPSSIDIPIRVEPYFKPAKTYTIHVVRDSTPPDVQFETDGNTIPGKTAESKVTVTDIESGVDPTSLQYVWAPSTSAPSNGWTPFESSDTLTQTSGDGNWYLHVRASDLVGNNAEVVSSAFVLDNTSPSVVLSSTASGTVNAPFPLTITFSEPVSGFTEEKIVVNNATVSNYAAIDHQTYMATITPITIGQIVTVQVAADVATDIAGNSNSSSNVLSFMYDTTKPTVTFDFTDNQLFTTPPTTVHISASEALYWVAGGSLVTSANALSLVSMEKDSVIFSDYVASYDEASYTFTFLFNSTLSDGEYKINVHGDKVKNARHNTLDAASASFIVDVPKVTAISANPTSVTSSGGSATVTITGTRLTDQRLDVYVDGVANATASVTHDTSAIATVTVPPNTTASAKTYRLTVYLNSMEVSGQFVTLTVLGDSTPPDIQFEPSGNASPTKKAESKVTVTDTESSVDPDSLQFVWTQNTEYPVVGWMPFASGNTLIQVSEDVSWYLHIRATDMVGNTSYAVSNAFVLDNTPPTVLLSSTASGMVNTAFPITITFNEPVTGFAGKGIVVDNAIVSDFATVDTKTYTATIIPITSGQIVNVHIESDVATDIAGNNNTGSNVLSIMYDTTKPAVTFDFTDGQIYTTPLTTARMSVSEAVYWVADGSLLTLSNALSLLSMEKDSVIFSDYVASYDEATYTFTFLFNGTLSDGEYKVIVDGNKVMNARHNTLDAVSASFIVDVPKVTAISANQTSFTSLGGSTTVTFTGHNLTGQRLDVYLDGVLTATASVIHNTSAISTVTLPSNTTTSAKTYRLTVDLNGVEISGQFLDLTVAPEPNEVITPTPSDADSPVPGNGNDSIEGSPDLFAVDMPVIDKNGQQLNPNSIDITKQSVILEVTPNKDGMAYVSIPASILSNLLEKNFSFMIEIKTPYGSYQVPVNLVSLIPGLNDLLAANNLMAEDTSFRIMLTDKSGDEDIQAAMAKGLPNGKVMGSIVDFSIEVINIKTGQTIEKAEKFSKALTRIIPMRKNLTHMPEFWGAFRYNATTEEFEFVPSRTIQIDGAWYVMIGSYTNSIYVIVDNMVSFIDVQKHWSQSFVELAAAKGIVNGIGDGIYSPNRTVTRAEFTAMLVRALGHGSMTGSTVAPYEDVQSGTWYFDAVAKGKEMGMLDFINGGNFKPDQPLIREEMASMLAAVIQLEKMLISSEFANLEGYKDIDLINSEFLKDVRLMVQLNIMNGTSTNTFNPKDVTTRAQAATVLIRLLQKLSLID